MTRLLQVIFLIAPLGILTAESISYDRQVRPILTSNCYQCHGPDAGSRKGDLRLDVESETRELLKEILTRITHKDLKEIMPPVKSGKKLSTSEIATIRTWIEEGAKWEKHWSLKPLKRPCLLYTSDAADE